MEHSQRARVGGGLVLILVGIAFLAVEVVPGLRFWVYGQYGWPVWLIGVGAALLLFGLVVGAPGMAVPACIVGGIGGLLYWQNATGRWETWAYAWTLIPGFVGVGVILAGLLQGRLRELEGGIWLILISLVLFAIFGSFLGGLNLFGPYWPALLIGLGALLLVRALVRPR